MTIYFNNTSIDINVSDNSFRYRSIMGEHSLSIYFSSPEYIDIPIGAYCMYQGQRYTLERPENFQKHGTRNFEYTLILEADQAKLGKYKLRNTVPGDTRLKFSYTARPQEFLQLIVDNLNQRDSGWQIGGYVEAFEKVVSFNHTSCSEALQMVAEAFETEWEVYGKTIHLRKTEYNKATPLSLSYGKGNGFKPGLGRTNFDNSKPVEILYVQGGERNIDFSKYGSKELLLPKSQRIRFDGTFFEGEEGFNAGTARDYESDAEGYSVFQYNKEPLTGEEDSLDLSNIYPSRIGVVTGVAEADAKKHFWDFFDTAIPEGLDYSKMRIAGEKMTIIFQSGMLAGKEFEIEQSDERITGYIHSERRFKLVPQEIDGITMPNEIFCPRAKTEDYAGDQYAVFGMMMPDEYVSDASLKMLRESVKYLYENEEPRFSFTGELDQIWAKRNWSNIGGKIVLGGYVQFSDTQFQKEGVLIRMVGIKDFVNNPYSPQIELSNVTVGGTVRSELRKIDQNEVLADEKNREVIRFAKRRFRSATETLKMLENAMLGFSNAVNPIAVQTMQMLVGDESLQFLFVDDKTNPTPVNHEVTFDVNKTLHIPAGIIQHKTLGIDTISSSHNISEYKFWELPKADLDLSSVPSVKYYLYAKVEKDVIDNPDRRFVLSDQAIDMESVSGYCHLLVGILNSEFEGEREFVQLYGFTEILPGRITTDRIVSSDGKTFFDLLRNTIGGTIDFQDGLVSGSIGIGNLNGINAGLSGEGNTDTDVRLWAGQTTASKALAPFRVLHDGSMYSTKGTLTGVNIESSSGGNNRTVLASETNSIELYDKQGRNVSSLGFDQSNRPYFYFRYFGVGDWINHVTDLHAGGVDFTSHIDTDYASSASYSTRSMIIRLKKISTNQEVVLNVNTRYLTGTPELRVTMNGLPTNKIGLEAGDLWRDGELLKIIP